MPPGCAKHFVHCFTKSKFFEINDDDNTTTIIKKRDISDWLVLTTYIVLFIISEAINKNNITPLALNNN